jgi:hypothetical protein
VPLSAPIEISVGSELDTTHGSVVVTAGTPVAGGLIAGEFDGGRFRLVQEQSLGGLVEPFLQGGGTAGCPAAGVPAPNGPSGVSALLHASVNGTFATRGRFASATVRGTEWTMTEQCDGTLTRVQRGVVSVQDLRTGRTINVPTGQSYLARAP